MANGYSIHIGLNGVDPNAYNGWAGTLAGCVKDANAMLNIAQQLGYNPVQLLNDQATSSAVIQAIGRAAQQMTSNDILFITYSGHGGIVDDATGGEPGDDGKDETWVLYDRMVLDDELQQLWYQFPDTSRIVVLSDSCHSGTVTRDVPNYAVGGASRGAQAQLMPVTKEAIYSQLISNSSLLANYKASPQKPPRFRSIPLDIQNAVYLKNRDFYSTRQWSGVRRSRSVGGATVLLISGCMDNQVSADGDGNGLFTGSLLQVWNNGAFSGTYGDFRNQIVSMMPATQTPNYFITGPANAGFEGQNPFTIDTPATSDAGSSRQSTVASPRVLGPENFLRNQAPPSFQVNCGPNSYYIFEIATDYTLFQTASNASKRNASNYYGSWQDEPGSHISSMKTVYTLPAAIWSRLKSANALYYRIGTMQGPTGWDNYIPSTYDDQAAYGPRLQYDISSAGAAA